MKIDLNNKNYLFKATIAILVNILILICIAGCNLPKRNFKGEDTEIKISNTSDEVNKDYRDPPIITFIDAYRYVFKDKNQSCIFLDVRKEDAYKKCHINMSINVPLMDSEKIIKDLDKEKFYIVYCVSKTCGSDVYVARILKSYGFKNIFILEKGINEWIDEGYPVVN